VVIRVLDIVTSISALILLLPLMVVIALAIFTDGGGPVLFAHRRVGQGGSSFPCYKFRSMVPDAAAVLEHLLATDPCARREWKRDHKLRQDPRVTRLGAFLRKTSLDELPQFLNVLAGHMSIVGPRPIVHEEVERYGRYFAAYCAQRPGLTGLWQISGRNNTSYRRRVAIDTVYSRSRSLKLYLYILAMTPYAVVNSRGCY
jgi:lipopolysaccharide/colanic/teichoic acid biosynthesis glycosyltransferase